MTNLIIASYTEEAKGVEASHKLMELESIGDITIFEQVIVKKNAEGESSVVQITTSEGLRPITGMALGSLIGAIAGPVGVLAGMLTGTAAGAAADEDYYSFGEDFGSKAIRELQPGTVAVIAEIEEDDNIFVDQTLASLNGALTRANLDYEYDKYSDEQTEALNEEIAAERTRIKSAATAEKKKIREKIEELKEKRKTRIGELKEKASKAITADFTMPLREKKISRLKNSIEKHQTRIASLEKELRELEHETVKAE